MAVTSRIHASPYLSRFPAQLDPSPYPGTLRYRVDSIGADPLAGLPDWWPGSVAPLVYITVGTVTGSLGASDQFYRAAVAAVGTLDARVLLTTGRGHTLDLGALPPQVHVEEWVEQVDVLREASEGRGHLLVAPTWWSGSRPVEGMGGDQGRVRLRGFCL